MQSFMNRGSEGKGKSSSNTGFEQHSQPSAVQFVDERSTTAAQRHLSDAINSSPKQVAQRQQFDSQSGDAVQLQTDEETFQMKAISGVVQCSGPEDEELLQGKFSAEPVQRKPEVKPNNTGLSGNLKTGIENLSGYSMDDVKVHYNSDKPAQLQAHAYAQGADIHIAPGQEKHLPHEAWHVVQQKQGRVRPTFQMNDKVNVNDDDSLEAEADVMGNKAAKSHEPNIDAKPNKVVPGDLITSLGMNKYPAQLKDDIGLGFSELGNEKYGQDDVFGKRHNAANNLSGFRDAVDAKGPGAFVKGVKSKRVEGGIQPVFTAGIKAAMAQSLTIKQNLAGFTTAQIDHARNHAPILTPDEADAAKEFTPMYKDYGPETAELWDSMKHIEDDRAWGGDISAISVWELSHMLHNEELFNKTSFYRYDASEDAPDVSPISSDNLSTYGIELNEEDIRSLQDLGIKASTEDRQGNWFTRLFCCCC